VAIYQERSGHLRFAGKRVAVSLPPSQNGASSRDVGPSLIGACVGYLNDAQLLAENENQCLFGNNNVLLKGNFLNFSFSKRTFSTNNALLVFLECPSTTAYQENVSFSRLRASFFTLKFQTPVAFFQNSCEFGTFSDEFQRT